jgi:hypothetical protein
MSNITGFCGLNYLVCTEIEVDEAGDCAELLYRKKCQYPIG